jgi:apolipoprotein N-acyltransferase
MRSQETGRAMMRSTNTGVSAFIDHKGRVIAQTEQFETQSITEVVQGRSGVTPFYYFAKIQGILAILPFIVVLILARRKAG